MHGKSLFKVVAPMSIDFSLQQTVKLEEEKLAQGVQNKEYMQKI